MAETETRIRRYVYITKTFANMMAMAMAMATAATVVPNQTFLLLSYGRSGVSGMRSRIMIMIDFPFGTFSYIPSWPRPSVYAVKITHA